MEQEVCSELEASELRAALRPPVVFSAEVSVNNRAPEQPDSDSVNLLLNSLVYLVQLQLSSRLSVVSALLNLPLAARLAVNRGFQARPLVSRPVSVSQLAQLVVLLRSASQLEVPSELEERLAVSAVSVAVFPTQAVVCLDQRLVALSDSPNSNSNNPNNSSSRRCSVPQHPRLLVALSARLLLLQLVECLAV